ncbi:hypothetical protein ACIPPS_13835 [Streptomyces sp. NPDC090127]|uniref:hypothetical protein n=1 Tax=Streptomyces sp. NPDC090127 TaxID=3365953 RepID=UPI0038104836
MPTTAATTTARPPVAALGDQERAVLVAVGCGPRDDEIADALALTEAAMAQDLARVLVKLGLRDRAAAIVHAYDCGLVLPGRGPARGRGPLPRRPTGRRVDRLRARPSPAGRRPGGCRRAGRCGGPA